MGFDAVWDTEQKRGKSRAQREILLRLIKKQSENVSPEIRACIAVASNDELSLWLEKIIAEPHIVPETLCKKSQSSDEMEWVRILLQLDINAQRMQKFGEKKEKLAILLALLKKQAIHIAPRALKRINKSASLWDVSSWLNGIIEETLCPDGLSQELNLIYGVSVSSWREFLNIAPGGR